MQQIKTAIILIFIISMFTACADDDGMDGLLVPEVEFNPPAIAEVGEKVELIATVTYGDELVIDATEMNFEYWLEDDQENSTIVDSINNKDGTYKVEVEFPEEGEYWIYAHTTARDIHTMPKRSIKVGQADENSTETAINKSEVNISLQLEDNITSNKETMIKAVIKDSTVSINSFSVRFEITNLDSGQIEWIESTPSENSFSANYTFKNASKYNISAYAEVGATILDPVDKEVTIQK